MPSYVTTPIYYVNAQPHLGHAYTTIITDCYNRFRRLEGQDTRFQTGTDEHGEKIVEAATRAGKTPKEYVDEISSLFRETWPILDVAPDHIIRTTNPEHMATVQRILQEVRDRGDIYFSEYSGLYCRGCERFLTEKELVDGKCPDHLKEPERIAEQNYFFRMSKYQDWLIDHIKKHPEFITPERYRNEVLAFLEEPLEDLCISRPTSRLTWGIPLPFDEKFVTYVWFDALINYLTGIGWPDSPMFAKYWQVAEHVVAKDILKPHAIYWPTMLKAMGLQPYWRLHVHGYWNVDSTKMSKSLGNVIRPKELVAEYGVDTVRYFLLREMSFGLDSSFSHDAILARQNADLANDLGNLFSRSLTMIGKYAAGTVPELDSKLLEPQDRELMSAISQMAESYAAGMRDFQFHKALQAVWETISLLNRYIVTNAPWELAKDASKATRLQTVLSMLAGSLWMIAITLKPVMPKTAEKMAVSLGMAAQLEAATLQQVGDWDAVPWKASLGETPHLFQRIDLKKKDAPKAVAKPGADAARAAEDDANLLKIDHFRALDLRVALVKDVQPVKKSEKLLQFTLVCPEERTVLSGIAQFYKPEDLLGKKVIVVANLKPAKLMGIMSQGMILSASETLPDGTERLKVLLADPAMTPGSRIS